MPGELLLDGILSADQNHLDAKLPSGEQHTVDHYAWGAVSAHRVNGDSRHGF
jgi:hypothetical protein